MPNLFTFLVKSVKNDMNNNSLRCIVFKSHFVHIYFFDSVINLYFFCQVYKYKSEIKIEKAKCIHLRVFFFTMLFSVFNEEINKTKKMSFAVRYFREFHI